MTIDLSAAAIAASLPADAFHASFVLRPPRPEDQAQMEALHDVAFGPGALARTAYRVREGQPPWTGYCRVVELAGAVIAMARFTAVRIGGQEGAVMLGPVAVAAEQANRGLARRLMLEGLAAAQGDGVALALLVGDPPYYGRLGFQAIPPGQIRMPGPVDPARLLAVELRAGALQRYGGVVSGGWV